LSSGVCVCGGGGGRLKRFVAAAAMPRDYVSLKYP